MSSSDYLLLAMQWRIRQKAPKIGKNHDRNKQNKKSKRGLIQVLDIKGTHYEYLNRKQDRLSNKQKGYFRTNEKQTNS